VIRRWREISPIRAIELRDSLRTMLERRGARRIDGATFLSDSSALNLPGVKLCVDSAAVLVISSRLPGARFEALHFLAAANGDPDCSHAKEHRAEGASLAPLTAP
jgi:hypothetical protein